MPQRTRWNKKLYQNHFVNQNKEFIALLIYAKEKGFSQTNILEAYRELTKRGVRKVSVEQIKAMLHGQIAQDRKKSSQDTFLTTQEEKIEKEATGILESITALMGAANNECLIYNNIKI